MKKTKILVPAAGLLLLSTAASVTGTVAWFAMNTSVSATGMQVKAKSNNTFLLIGEESLANADAIQAQTGDDLVSEALSVTDGQAEVFPASPILPAYVSADANLAPASHKYFPAGTTVVSNATTAATPANWFTAQNNNPGSSNDSVKNVQTLVADNDGTGTYEFSKYVIKRTVKLTLADGSDAAHNLTVTPTIAIKTTEPAQTATDISAVRALVACGSNYVILNSSMNAAAQSLHATADFTLTDNAVTTVDIYVYYDGEATAVYTNNVLDLAFATVDFAFGVEVGTAA